MQGHPLIVVIISSVGKGERVLSQLDSSKQVVEQTNLIAPQNDASRVQGLNY